MGYDGEIIAKGEIEGNTSSLEYGAIISLSDGTYWYQTDYSSRYISYGSKAKVVEGDYGDACLIIEGERFSVEKVRIEYEDEIDGDFHGWDGNTIYKLENGDAWEQDDYTFLSSYSYKPRVTILCHLSDYYMQVDDTEIVKVKKSIFADDDVVSNGEIKSSSSILEIGAILSLGDGTYWHLTDFNYSYIYSGTEAKILKDDYGKYWLIADRERLEVEEIKDIEEGVIDGNFNGWSGNNVYKLENGDAWKQNDLTISVHYLYNPEVRIISHSCDFYMQVEDTEIVKVEKFDSGYDEDSEEFDEEFDEEYRDRTDYTFKNVQVNFCSRCGARVSIKGQHYCTKCGYRLT